MASGSPRWPCNEAGQRPGAKKTPEQPCPWERVRVSAGTRNQAGYSGVFRLAPRAMCNLPRTQNFPFLQEGNTIELIFA